MVPVKAQSGDLSSRYSDQGKGKQVFIGKSKKHNENPPLTRMLVFSLSSVSSWEAIAPVVITAFQSLGKQQALK